MAFGGYRFVACLLLACAVPAHGEPPRTGKLRGSWHLRALQEYARTADEDEEPAPAPAPEAAPQATDSDSSAGGNSTGNSTNSTNKTSFLDTPLNKTGPCYSKESQKKGVAKLLNIDNEGLPDVSDIVAMAPTVDLKDSKRHVIPCPGQFPTVRPAIKRAIDVMEHGTGMGPVMPSQIQTGPSLLQLDSSRAEPAAAAATKKTEAQADELLAEARALKKQALGEEASAVTDLNFEVEGNINIGKTSNLAGNLEWATATLYNGKVQSDPQARFESGFAATPEIDAGSVGQNTAQFQAALNWTSGQGAYVYPTM